jgi:hypothetical protein
MAKKEVVFGVKVETGKSVKNVQDLDKSLDNLNQATEETTKSTKDVNATFEDVYGDLQPLTTRLGEAEDRLYELSLAGETASDEFKELLEVVTNYRKTQIAVDQAVDASATTMGQKLVANVEFGASAFQAFESASALAGVESEKLVQTMVKLQAIQGVVGSIKALQQGLKESTIGMKLLSLATGGYNLVVGTSTGLMKAFRIALLATGIGALVVGIVALITNFKKLFGFITPVIDALKDFGDWIGLTNFAEEEASAEREIRHQNEMARIEAERQARETAFNERQDQFNREIALAKALGKETLEIESKRIKDKIAFNARERNENQKTFDDAVAQNKALEKVYKNAGATERAFLRAGIEANNEKIKSYKKYVKNVKDGENELKILFINDAKEKKQKEDKDLKERNSRYKQFVENRKREQERLFKIEQKRLFDIQKLEDEFLNEIEKLDEEHFQMTLSQQEKEETAVNDKYFRLIETAKKYGMDITDLEAKQQIELAVIREKFAEEELKKAEELNKKRAELRENFDALFRDQFDQSIKDLRDANAEQLKVLQEANDQELISDGEFYLAKLKLANDLADAEKKIEKEKNEFIKQEQIKAREQQLEGVNNLLENAQKALDGLNQINDLVNQIDQARLNSIQNQRDENLESLDANLQAQLRREDLTAEQKAQIEESFAQQKFAIQQKAFEEEEKIKKAQFNRDKALKLAQVSIDTASAIVKAIAQFGPPPSPLGIAGIASAGVIGLTQALAILNQQYQGGSAPSPPQIGGGQSAGALAGAGASAFTANTQAEQTDLSTIGEDVPVSQVVVLESDITGTQSKVAVQEAKSSF